MHNVYAYALCTRVRFTRHPAVRTVQYPRHRAAGGPLGVHLPQYTYRLRYCYGTATVLGRAVRTAHRGAAGGHTLVRTLTLALTLTLTLALALALTIALTLALTLSGGHG